MASRSLGTLTLDLVAETSGYVGGLSKAERESEKWRRKVKRDLETVAKNFTLLGITAAGGIAALSVQTVKAAQEISNLSRVANTSSGDFQKFAAGASAFGIEQEKLADILKDTTDKVGDFLQTGGGPLADFFENIAPQVGVTADQFRDLSGADALQLYVKSLQDANVSQNEMTFFLEAIASDATLLLPLLENNGEAMKVLGDHAERTGVILSDKVIKNARELNATMLLLKQSTTGAKNQLVEGLLPGLADLSSVFFDATSEGNSFVAVGEFISAGLGNISAAAVGSVATFDLLGESIGGLAAALVAFASGEFSRASSIIDELGSNLDKSAIKYGQMIQDLSSIGEGADLKVNERVKELAALLGKARNVAQGSSRAITESMRDQAVVATDLAGVEQDRINQINGLFESQRDGMQRQIDLYGDVTNASKVRYETEKGALAELSAQQKQFLIDQATELDRKDSDAQSKADEERINNQAQRIADSLRSEEQMIADSYARRRDIILQNTEVTGTAQIELLAKLEQQRQDELEELEGKRQLTMLQNQELLYGSLADLAKQFAGEQSGVYRALFALEKAAAVARAIVAIQTGIAQAAAQPFPLNLAAIAQVAGATAGIVGTIQGTSIQGVAHSGLDKVPTTGTYLLEKGERVVTEKTSAKLDRKLDQVGTGGQSSSGGGNIRIVNAFDTEVVGDYMGSDSGERLIMNTVRRNQATIRELSN